jgi:pimeloyl-ACP methyl ester carboxylesterase
MQTTTAVETTITPRGPLVPRFISLATGVRIEYVEQGSDTGVPVVFLHGVTDSWRSFEGVLAQLPPTVRAFAISQRGHGLSGKPERGYRFNDFADDVLAFMDAMGLQRAVLVGHSMGASVAQRVIVSHPERVSRLVLMGAFAGLHQNPGIAEFVAAQIRPLRDPIDPEFARHWQLSTVATELGTDLLETVVRETLKVPATVWHQAFDGFLEEPDVVADLAAVRVPTLIIWGDQDAYAGRSDQDALVAALPAAQLSVYAGIGHAVHWEAPERCTTEIVRFLI